MRTRGGAGGEHPGFRNERNHGVWSSGSRQDMKTWAGPNTWNPGRTVFHALWVSPRAPDPVWIWTCPPAQGRSSMTAHVSIRTPICAMAGDVLSGSRNRMNSVEALGSGENHSRIAPLGIKVPPTGCVN